MESWNTAWVPAYRLVAGPTVMKAAPEAPAGRDPALVIEVDDAKDGGSDYGDGEAWYGAAQTVIDSLVVSR